MLWGCASSAGSRRPSGLWRELYAQGDEPCARFAELRREQIAADRRLIACREALTEDRVDATVILNRPGDLQYPERAHLFQHDIHHRGQVHAMLAGTAVPPPQLDAFFLRRDAPLRAQEMRALVFAGS